MARRGLYENIHRKRARISAGSGEKIESLELKAHRQPKLLRLQPKTAKPKKKKKA